MKQRLHFVAMLMVIAGFARCVSAQQHTITVPHSLPATVDVPTSINFAKPFTLRLCVRMDSAPTDLPNIVANKAWEDGAIEDYTTNNAYGVGRTSGSARGFAFSVLSDGAWTWNVGNGSSRADHRPEAADQNIADGRWHEIGCSFDRANNVAHLYHDGRRVAIHDLHGITDLSSDVHSIQLGSSTSEMEIRAVRIDADVLAPSTIEEQFIARFGENRQPSAAPTWNGTPLKVLAWNIWHGGRRKGRDEGVARVVETIRACDADIVLMQETYGSGPRISGRLGYDYYLRSSNLSVMSRYPIVDVHRLGPSFRFGGVTIELRPGVHVQAYSLWIDYLPSVEDQLAAGASGESLAAEDDKTRGRDMRVILNDLIPHLGTHPDLPVIVGGDFNSGSHLDWTEEAATLDNHMGRVVQWPVSVLMADAGFVDTYRTAHPDPIAHPGLTWSPEFPEAHQDRIDYVYVRGDDWTVLDSVVLRTHPRGWPSDHAAVLSTLQLDVD